MYSMRIDSLMTTAFITHPDCLKHDMGAHHPRAPGAAAAIEDQLIASGIGRRSSSATKRRWPRTSSSRACIRLEYVRAIREVAPRSGTVHLDPDTAMNPHSLARRAARSRRRRAGDRSCHERQSRQRLLRRASAGPSRRRARARWASASSTTSRSRRAHALEHTASSASRSSTSTCTTATAPRIFSRATTRADGVASSSIRSIRTAAPTIPAPNMVNVPLPPARAASELREAVEQVLAAGARGVRAAVDLLLGRFRRARRGRHGDAALHRRRLRAGSPSSQGRGRPPRGGRIVSMLEGGYALSALGAARSSISASSPD